MVDHEIVERVTRLPASQRLQLIELLSRSLRNELQAPARSAEQPTDTSVAEMSAKQAAIERLAGSLKLAVPEDSSLWRVLGIGATDAPAPTDEELEEDYVNYLTRKYS